ncbi:RNA-directed DNA polymerase from mobile element jockey-like, partial [Paramuricea clavata]
YLRNEAALLSTDVTFRGSTILTKSHNNQLKLLLSILLSCGDIQINPGPITRYSCEICRKSIKSNVQSIQCEKCSAWYHTNCCNVNTPNTLSDSCIWICNKCDVPNFSTSLLNNHLKTPSLLSNSFSALDNQSSPPATPSRDSNTVFASTPNPIPKSKRVKAKRHLKGMIINCNGLKGTSRFTEFQALLDLHNPDVVLGTESKLHNDIPTYSVFPSNYTVYRKDRNANGGGVFHAVKSDIVCEECPKFDANCEILWSSVLNEFMSHASENFFLSSLQHNSVSENWLKFKLTLIKGIQDYVPHKKSTPKYKLPWITSAIKRHMRLKDRLHKKALKSHKPKHWDEFKKERNLVSRLVKQSHSSYLNDVIGASLHTNPKKFWSYVRTIPFSIHPHVSKHLAYHDILINEQHGFRKLFSCETQLITAINDWAKSINQKKQTDVILLDFSKAFDSVPHLRLMSKLDHYGIRGLSANWIKAFLSNRSQVVSVNGYHPHPQTVISGVPQGTILAPVLFLLYINDISENIKSQIRLFADDGIIYREINNDQDHKNPCLEPLHQEEHQQDRDEHPGCLISVLTAKFSRSRPLFSIMSFKEDLMRTRQNSTIREFIHVYRMEKSNVVSVDIVNRPNCKTEGNGPYHQWRADLGVIRAIMRLSSNAFEHERAEKRCCMLTSPDIGRNTTKFLTNNNSNSYSIFYDLKMNDHHAFTVFMTINSMARKNGYNWMKHKQCLPRTCSKSSIVFRRGVPGSEEVGLIVSAAFVVATPGCVVLFPITTDVVTERLSKHKRTYSLVRERETTRINMRCPKKIKPTCSLEIGRLITLRMRNRLKRKNLNTLIPSLRNSLGLRPREFRKPASRPEKNSKLILV